MPVTSNMLQVWFWALLVVGLGAVLIGVIYYFRNVRSAQNDPSHETHSMLSGFRDLHERGELSEAEYRTIKSTLSARLKAELQQKKGAG